MFRMQSISAAVYGGGVTLAEWWDSKRITEGAITKKDIAKKAETWVYLGVGLVATLSSAFGWWRRQEAVLEPISHGFLYALPGFIYHTIQDTKTTAGGRTRSDAVAEAQRILEQRRMALHSGFRTGVPVVTPAVPNEAGIIVSST